MKYLAIILAAAIVIWSTGCVLSGKPATATVVPATPKPVVAAAPPPSPPPPLSVPQIHPQLPPPQPVSVEAVAAGDVPGEPPAPPPAPSRGVPKKKSDSASRPRPAETAAPPPAAAPPAAAPPEADPPRATVSEILPTEDLNKLRESVDQHKREINKLLSQVPRRLSQEQKTAVETIHSFVRLSDEAERSGDLRKANELAERGLVLAQGLPGAR